MSRVVATLQSLHFVGFCRVFFLFRIYIKRKVKIVVKLMTSEHSDSDDNCDELSELRNRRDFETQPSVDVSNYCSSSNCE